MLQDLSSFLPFPLGDERLGGLAYLRSTKPVLLDHINSGPHLGHLGLPPQQHQVLALSLGLGLPPQQHQVVVEPGSLRLHLQELGPVQEKPLTIRFEHILLRKV